MLLHCVAAQQRTPTCAVAYAVRRGVSPESARDLIAEALPHSRRRGLLWEAAVLHGTEVAR